MMKKIISLLAFAILLFVSCGSTKVPQGSIQRDKEGIPRWASEGVSFYSTDAEVYGAPTLSEEGFYTCGVSENMDNNTRLTSSAAALSAKRNLAAYIQTNINSVDKRISSGTNINYSQIDESSISVKLNGVRIIDNYTYKDGTVYALAFISDKDLKRNFSDTPESNALEDLLGKLKQ